MIDVDQWGGHVRIHDETGTTHLARLTTRSGTTLCHDTASAPRLSTHIIDPIAMPGDPWPGGTVCAECARIASN